jgi:hypothetical protein
VRAYMGEDAAPPEPPGVPVRQPFPAHSAEELV